MSGSPEEWYRALPTITRGYLTGAFATTILCQLEFIQPQLLILDFGALVGSLEPVATPGLTACVGQPACVRMPHLARRPAAVSGGLVVTPAYLSSELVAPIS